MINNLGSYPGGPEVDCTSDIWYPCECGCGCRCLNGDDVAPSGTPAELRYGKVGKYFDGTGGPGAPFDLGVTNLTGYRPWNSMENGRSWPENNFAQINLAADSATDFAMNFYKPARWSRL